MNVCEHMTQGLRGMDGGKFKRKLLEVNTRAVSRRQNELLGKFKMAAGDNPYLSLLSRSLSSLNPPFSSISLQDNTESSHISAQRGILK